MRLKRRLALALATGLALSAAGAFALRARMLAAAARYTPPVYVEPAAGPRAPRVDFLGAHFGVSRLADVEGVLASWKVSCRDRSARTLMTELRDHKREELARAGGNADLVSGASIVSRRTARDENPQVRIGCEGVASESLRDRDRPASAGRALFVFDTESSVVRHASYQRNHAGWNEAQADFENARGALSAVLGAAGEAVASPSGETGAEAPPKYGRRAAEWRFTDLSVTVSVVNLGSRGFSVSESVEVPIPVRADAAAGHARLVVPGGFRASDDSR